MRDEVDGLARDVERLCEVLDELAYRLRGLAHRMPCESEELVQCSSRGG